MYMYCIHDYHKKLQMKHAKAHPELQAATIFLIIQNRDYTSQLCNTKYLTHLNFTSLTEACKMYVK